jgi:hypothetical protein
MSVDTSIVREFTFSLQLLATAHCSLKSYEIAISVWEKAIEKARDNLRGIEVGVAMDSLAVVLYNAAICNSHIPKQLTRALSLVKETIEIDKKRSSDMNINGGDEKNNISAQRNLSQQLLSTIQDRINYYKANNIDINRDRDRDNVIELYSSIDDSGDWEECLEGEDGCEMFYMDEDDNNDDINNIVSNINSINNIKDSNDYNSDSDSGDVELEEIRLQYEMQSSRYRTIGNKDNNNSIDIDTDSIIKNLKEKIIELTNRLDKCENK